MATYRVVKQPTVDEVQTALNSTPGIVRLVIKCDDREEERMVTVNQVTRHRKSNTIDFGGTCPHVVGDATQHWNARVNDLSEDPGTATYQEDYFFL